MAFKHSTYPPDPPPPRIVSPNIAQFKGFWEFAWANMGQTFLKIALNHLLSTPSGMGTILEKSFLTTVGPTSEPCNPTLACAPCTVVVRTNRALKGVSKLELHRK